MGTPPSDMPPAALRPSAPNSDTSFFGHPRGLSVLFFSEMWERFSYYGMRALLMLFMTAPTATGGLGFSIPKAGLVYGVYTSMVYLLGVPGGWIADKFLGLRRAVLWGGVLIMLGHVALALPAVSTFYAGLVLVMIGTGLLKPNISAMVGQLYGKDDPRRDSGFSIYYMGINIGAFAAPLLCGYLAQQPSFRSFLSGVGISPNSAWHFGFAMAAIGMGAGLIQYVLGWRHLGDAGVRPYQPSTTAEASRNRTILVAILAAVFLIPAAVGLLGSTGTLLVNEGRVGLWFGTFLLVLVAGLFGGLFGLGKWSIEERRRLLVVLLLFFGAIVLWALFEQAGSTMNLFAEHNTRNTVFGFGYPASWFQSVNSVFVIALSPVFAFIWLKLARARRDPPSPIKFAIGLVLIGAGFLLMVPAAQLSAKGILVSPWWLVGLYFLHTCGELCISPVGLSAMTRLAPSAISGMVMGIWFLGAAVGNYVAGRMGGLYGSIALDKLLLYQLILPAASAIIFFVLSGPIRRMLARSEPVPPGH
ncbi:MAG TPA: peptide MFS transporter [Kofleriaceae bacterium]|nr:peptide MFS transporter [Kofleriaceae bacterium]